MTANQLRFWELKETQRSNRAKEADVDEDRKVKRQEADAKMLTATQSAKETDSKIELNKQKAREAELNAYTKTADTFSKFLPRVKIGI